MRVRGRDLEPTECVGELLETLLSYSHSPIRQFYILNLFLGFSGSSPGKESTCKADLSSTPGSGGFPWRKGKLPTAVFLGFPAWLRW